MQAKYDLWVDDRSILDATIRIIRLQKLNLIWIRDKADSIVGKLEQELTILFSPQVVSAAEDKVCPGVQGGAHPAQPAVTTGTLQTVLMPEPV